MKKIISKILIASLALAGLQQLAALPVNAVTATSGGVTVKQPSIDTYRFATGFYDPGTTPTCVLSISGIANKKLKLLRLRLAYTISTNSASFPDKIFINKRSTLNTGGTSTTETSVANDSASGSSSAVVKSYTVKPSSLGTLVGRIASLGIYGNLSAPSAPPTMVIYEAPITGAAETLNNANELIEVSWNGVTPLGGTPLIAIDGEYSVE